ncbi:MAG: hypothetical protein U1E17_01050 [Geminicoccaceae bacterium]
MGAARQPQLLAQQRQLDALGLGDQPRRRRSAAASRADAGRASKKRALDVGLVEGAVSSARRSSATSSPVRQEIGTVPSVQAIRVRSSCCTTSTGLGHVPIAVLDHLECDRLHGHAVARRTPASIGSSVARRAGRDRAGTSARRRDRADPDHVARGADRA